MTTFIRTPNRQTLLEALRSADLLTTDEDGTEGTLVESIITSSHTHFIDVIGTITRTIEPAEYDDDGEMTKPGEYETLDGYHANWVGTVPASLAEYVIEAPRKPARVIAS